MTRSILGVPIIPCKNPLKVTQTQPEENSRVDLFPPHPQGGRKPENLQQL